MTQATIIPLFKEQLENQCAKLGDSHQLSKRGDHLIWWYFSELEGFTPDEIEDVHCDGSGDMGIDAICIDDDDVVHVYLFKHPEDPDKAFPVSGVDAFISGLRMIFQKDHTGVSNPKLRERIDAILQVVPSKYRIHVVTSGAGISDESRKKLDSFVAGIPVPTPDFFTWRLEDLDILQERFYQQHLPAIADPVVFGVDRSPYLMQSGSAACYLFALPAEILVAVYARHGEPLLHRNIRAYQGDTAANRAIYGTCTGEKALDFVHFNNGISFLADESVWDPIQNTVTLYRSQVVNGGQTLRILHKASEGGSLKPGVKVTVRVIRSGGDKQFGSDVTVNQNNQNSMQTGFLRANDPCVVQLATSLTSLGWYFERRKGELKSLKPDEQHLIEHRIGHSLSGRVIRLKEGTQAYVATYFRQPELAKKNPKKMFQTIADGGYFERIFSGNISAEKMVTSTRILAIVEDFVHRFNLLRNRKKKRGDDPLIEAEYRSLLGNRLVDSFPGTIEQAVPQSAIFLCATIFQEWADVLGKDPDAGRSRHAG